MSLPHPAGSPSVPLTVIGGYLGAGKTTLLSQILRADHGLSVGVIVNDVGEVGIDAELLATSGVDGVVDLPNGCVCCSLNGELLDALTTLLSRPVPLDHILIEASGVADPAAVAAWGTVPPLRPGGVLVCVAADRIAALLRNNTVAPEVGRQIDAADLILLTKTDLADEPTADRARATLSSRNPRAPVVDVIDGDIPLEVLIDVDPAPATGGPHHHNPGAAYRTWSWTTAEPVDRDRIDGFLRHLPDGILRAKGPIRFAGDTHRHHVDVVGRRIEITPRRDDGCDSTLVFIALADEVDESTAARTVP